MPTCSLLRYFALMLEQSAEISMFMLCSVNLLFSKFGIDKGKGDRNKGIKILSLTNQAKTTSFRQKAKVAAVLPATDATSNLSRQCKGHTSLLSLFAA